MALAHLSGARSRNSKRACAKARFTVVTGDLVDHGEPDEYEQLRHLTGTVVEPVFVIPGNHHAREPLREARPWFI